MRTIPPETRINRCQGRFRETTCIFVPDLLRYVVKLGGIDLTTRTLAEADSDIPSRVRSIEILETEAYERAEALARDRGHASFFRCPNVGMSPGMCFCRQTPLWVERHRAIQLDADVN